MVDTYSFFENMKKILYLISVFSLLSCDSDDNIPENQYLGNYKLTALTSNIPLDLNFDNSATINFKNELNVYFLGNSKPLHDLQFVQSNTPNEWFFRLGLPKDNYHPDQIFLEQRYGTGDYSKSLHLNNNIFSIKNNYSDLFVADSIWLIENKYPYPYELNFSDNNKAIIKIKQKFYDNINLVWVETDLIAEYEKL
jgi:hypothetical protein